MQSPVFPALSPGTISSMVPAPSKEDMKSLTYIFLVVGILAFLLLILVVYNKFYSGQSDKKPNEKSQYREDSDDQLQINEPEASKTKTAPKTPSKMEESRVIEVSLDTTLEDVYAEVFAAVETPVESEVSVTTN